MRTLSSIFLTILCCSFIVPARYISPLSFTSWKSNYSMGVLGDGFKLKFVDSTIRISNGGEEFKNYHFFKQYNDTLVISSAAHFKFKKQKQKMNRFAYFKILKHTQDSVRLHALNTQALYITDQLIKSPERLSYEDFKHSLEKTGTAAVNAELKLFR